MKASASEANDRLDNPAFYDRHWVATDTTVDPHVAAKAERIVTMVPEGVRTILDVGCGDGTITHRLAELWDVTAVDRSPVALSRVRVPAVEASADALPFEDASMDLVFSSEVLEHLPDEVLRRAVREMTRVSKRYVLISVPHDENLRKRFVRCPKCALEFHVDGHLHSFKSDSLARLFPEHELLVATTIGPDEPFALASVERFRQRVMGRWWLWNPQKLSCPRCSFDEFSRPERSAVLRFVDRRLDDVTRLAGRLRGELGSPYWLVALFEKRSSRV